MKLFKLSLVGRALPDLFLNLFNATTSIIDLFEFFTSSLMQAFLRFALLIRLGENFII
jgi:hypothetical protein